MITLKEIRNKTQAGKTVWKKTFKGISTKVQQTPSGYFSYVDGDFLDKFKSQKDAIKSIETAIRELT
jgi:hypothetical protein